MFESTPQLTAPGPGPVPDLPLAAARIAEVKGGTTAEETSLARKCCSGKHFVQATVSI
jgi:hypothetical protein